MINGKTFGLFCCFFVIGSTVYSQAKFTTESGHVDFTSNAELELIKATTEKVRGLVDSENNQVAFTIELASFVGFNSALQREHFLEKYMETDRFPRAQFSGKIIEHVNLLTDGIHDVRVKGTLDIHGQTQVRIIKGKIEVSGGRLKMDSDFIVPLVDHNISIPSIVNRKIATEIDVRFHAVLSLK